MAERYGDELAAALPEADAVVGFAGEGALAERRAARPQADRRARSARAAAARADGAVGVREDRRRLRPRVRVLRDPVVPRQAALADAGVDRGRSARARRARRRRDRARRAGPRVVRARHRRARFARAVAAPARRARAPTAWRASGCSTSIRPRCTTRSSSTMLELPTVVPYFDLSLQHASRRLLRRMKRWGSGERFLADDRRASAPRSPTPRSARRSSSGSPARPKPITTSCSRSSPTAELDWAGFFPFSRRGRHRRASTLDGEVDAALDARAAARVRRGAGSDHRRGARRAGRARRSRCSSTGRRRRRSRRPHATARRRRSTVSSASWAADVYARPGAIVHGDGVTGVDRSRSRGDGRDVTA